MEALSKNYIRIFSLKQAKRVVIILTLVFLFDFLFFPLPAMADEIAKEANMVANTNELMDLNRLPESANWSVKWSGNYTITAYTSEAAQTDNSPCITANGFNLCEHGLEDTVAANFLSFGTKIRIPELFGDKIFIVRDRMNTRYTNVIDIWMLNKDDAKKFGVKLSMVEIFE